MYFQRLIHSFKSQRERQGSGQIQWVGFIYFFAAGSIKYTQVKKSKQAQIAVVQVEDGS